MALFVNMFSLAKTLRIPVQEELFSVRDVYQADECFLQERRLKFCR